MAPGFGLPPRVHNRHVPFADDVMIPVPSLGIDRLAHGAKHAQVRQVIFRDPLIPLAHQRANGGGGGVELVHLVLFTDLPKAARIRVGWHTFKHNGCRAIRERAIDNIAMPGDPADVSGTPEDVALLIIKRVLVRHRRIHDIAAGRMHHALGHTSGA